MIVNNITILNYYLLFGNIRSPYICFMLMFTAIKTIKTPDGLITHNTYQHLGFCMEP